MRSVLHLKKGRISDVFIDGFYDFAVAFDVLEKMQLIGLRCSTVNMFCLMVWTYLPKIQRPGAASGASQKVTHDMPTMRTLGT